MNSYPIPKNDHNNNKAHKRVILTYQRGNKEDWE